MRGSWLPGLALAAVLCLAAAHAHGARAAAAPAPFAAEKIVVVKSERRLYLLRAGQVLKSYRVALGPRPLGTKLYQGDGRTPEGIYRVTGLNTNSRFYRSIRLSYPNEEDLARARLLGQVAGGDIMIHGLPPERQALGATQWRFDWTNGCIALANEEIDEIWQRVTVGTPIEIRP